MKTLFYSSPLYNPGCNLIKGLRKPIGFAIRTACIMLLIFASMISHAQTVLTAGDVAVVGLNAANPDKFSVVLLKDIDANTVINFTDNGFTGTNTTGRTGEGFLTYTSPAAQTAGTVITWTNGVTAAGWSSAAPTNFAFNAAGDQLFAFQGATANWVSQSGITLLFGMNYGIALTATSGAGNTLQPDASILPSTAFLNLPTSTNANGYFANGATSSSTVSVTGTAAALLALIADASKWYGNSATASTFPLFNFTVTTGSTSVISTTGTPSALSTTYGTVSSETSFNVSGVNMTAGILVTAPSGYEVSLTSGGSFTSTLTVGAAGTISSTPVYVRLASTTIPDNYSGNIVLSSSGASTVNVATTASIVNQKQLGITGITANNKSFDGNTTATLSGTATLNGVLIADVSNVVLGGTPVATFASSAVGTGIAVTVTGYTISGSAAAYYTLDQPTGLTANITSSSLLSQSITFNALANVTYGAGAITLTATASSGLPVSYTSSNTNVATISGNTLTIVGAGSTTITASQAGNASYLAASIVLQTQVVNQKQLTVTGATAANKVYDGTTNATINGSVLVGIVGSDIVTINNTGTFTSANVGTAITVTSTQSLGGANAINYSLLLPTSLSADITIASQTITFGALSNKAVGDAPYALSATASSGLAVTYASSNTSVATVSGNIVTIVGAGTTNITASQAGNSNYLAAADVTQTLTVTAAAVPTVLNPGDIAVIGYNTSGSPDNVALLIMKDLNAGTVFYVNDNEVSTAGGSTFTDLNEGEASFTVNAGQTIYAGTVVLLPWGTTAVTTTQYTWTTTSGFGLGNSNEEIYVYTAPTIASTTPTNFIYFAKVGSSASAISAGLTSGITAIAPAGSANRYSTTGAVYTGCPLVLLTAIGDLTTNWNTTGATTIAATDWTFNVLPTCGTISSTGTPVALSTVYGTASSETSFNVSGIDMTSGILVTPPAGFEVSLTSGGTFTPTVTLGSAGTIASTTVYIRLASSTNAGTYSGDIVISSFGSTSVLVPMPSSTVSTINVTISGVTANNKNFDGNTTATLSGTPVLNGVLSGDIANVTIGGTPVATFANAAVGTGIALTVSGYSLSGSAAINYSLTQPTGLVADILATSLLNQTITFNALPSKIYGASTFNLTATASSGLPVTYVSSNTNVATIAGNVVTIVGVGSTNITASQAGNATYNPAIDVTQTQVVTPKQLTVTGAVAFNKVYDGNTDATIFGSTLVGIVGSDIVTINGTGSFATANVGTAIAVTSTQILGGANASNYSVLLPTGLTADITPASQTITFGALPNKSTADAPFALTATASSGLTVTYTSSNPLVATVSGNIVTIVGPGSTDITASQIGDANTSAATPVVQTLLVTQAILAGDIAVIGYNTSGIPDNFALLVLRDLEEGSTFYVSDNEVAIAGGTVFTDLAEGEASFTVKAGQTIPAGTVLVLPWGATAVSTALYDWSTTSGFGLGNNNEEIYVYTASSITSLSPNSFIYYAKIGTGVGAIPAGLTSGTTAIAPTGTALRYSTTGALYVSCIPDLLAAIGDISTNWNTTGASAIVETDWAFTILPACATISYTGSPVALSTTYGTASAPTTFNVSGLNTNAGILVTPPSGFEVALSAAGPYSTFLITGGAGTIPSTTIYIQLAATTLPGTYTGDVVLSSLGASSVNVSIPSSVVDPKPLSISGIAANNKIFDGNTNATLSGTPGLNGIETADIGNVTLSGTPIATFASAAVGNNIAVSVTGYTLTGSAAAYYSLLAPAGLTANITATSLLNQTITFNSLPVKTYGDASFNLTATASSGLTVSYTSSNTSVATIAGNVVTILSAGSTIITASQSGNSTYNPAIDITQTLTVNPKQLTVSGASASDKMYDGTVDAIITGSVLNGVVGSDIVTINGTGTFATANAGTGIAVTSTQVLSGANASNYTVLLPTGLTATISQASQTITFAALPVKTTADVPFTLTATASSGLTVTYTSSNPLVATVSGNTVIIVGPGSTTITASQSGDANYLAAVDVTQVQVVNPLPSVTDVIMPQYMQGVNGTNSNRIPFASYLTLNYLLPSTTYRYFTAVVIASDAATSNGAGNPIFVSPSGFTKSSSASLATAGGYATFTTDANGNYSGWFAIEPTGNASRFIPGNNVFIRININDGANGTVVATRLTSNNSAKVINLVAAAGTNNGTGLRGLSAATDKNFVLVYDNINGTGRPISASFVESDGVANTASYAAFYVNNVDGISGAYGVVIPNVNANGIQRVEQRSIIDASLVGCPSTDADGVWPSGANTVNPTGGTTAVVLTSTDANLPTSCSTELNLKCYIQGYWNNVNAMLPVLANQGEISTSTACDSITVDLREATSPYASVASVKTVLNQDGTALCTFPSLNGSYYIQVRHRNAIQTWSAMPVTFGATPSNYDFSDAASKAYGDNQIEVSTGIWAFYTGDLVADENLDLLDLGVVETDISNFSFGYLASDINGDGNVDLLDSSPVEQNISNFIFSNHP